MDSYVKELDRTLADVSVTRDVTVFGNFLFCFIFGFQTVIVKPKLVLLVFKHAYATTKYLR